jgi:hypothetical protein
MVEVQGALMNFDYTVSTGSRQQLDRAYPGSESEYR